MLTHVLVCSILFTKKSLKVPKVQSEAVSRGMTTNTMAQGKRKKQQIMFYKTLHRKLRINQHEPHKEPEVTLRRFRKVTNSTSDICRVIL